MDRIACRAWWTPTATASSCIEASWAAASQIICASSAGPFFSGLLSWQPFSRWWLGAGAQGRFAASACQRRSRLIWRPVCGPREAIRTAEIRLAEVGTFRTGQKAHAAGIEPVMDFSWSFRAQGARWFSGVKRRNLLIWINAGCCRTPLYKAPEGAARDAGHVPGAIAVIFVLAAACGSARTGR